MAGEDMESAHSSANSGVPGADKLLGWAFQHVGRTAEELAELVVPRLADLAMIDV